MTTPDEGPSTELPAGTWERLAALASEHLEGRGRVTASELKTAYERAVRNAELADEVEFLDAPPARSAEGDCVNFGPFEFNLYSVVSAGFEGQFCNPPNWSLRLKAWVKVAGYTVWEEEINLSPENYCYSREFNYSVAKGNLNICVQGPNYCLNISGQACAWFPIIGWKCGDFDWTPICFG
ncbi:hypothetical protein [Streptomyces sp. YIM 98790]|uniref:hypothetical protein n=1 Tax=Streptomyces sp. YIM 98790 TaxID=2689077 RepID=UPI00140A33B0|nr:hypothetical protein [Streptomyces sp. YIM 98790]